MFGLAAVVGQALGGILISLNLLNLGWRTIFLVNLPLAILVMLFGVPLLKETGAQHARKLALGGTALSMLTLGTLIMPLIEGREAGWPVWAWVSLIAVPALAVFFWRYELMRLCIRRLLRIQAGGERTKPTRSGLTCWGWHDGRFQGTAVVHPFW